MATIKSARGKPMMMSTRIAIRAAAAATTGIVTVRTEVRTEGSSDEIDNTV
jgi:hypothetical protein